MILVLDGCDEARHLIADELRGFGYVVLEASSGAEAVDVAERCRDRIDLLLTDMILPDTTGQGVVEHLAAICPELAIVFMSGYPRELLEAGELPPGTAFLKKPFSGNALMLEVRRALRQRAPHRILVVEDDPNVSRFLARALRRGGFDVLLAENGKRAIATLATEPVDLLITDLVMPEMDGLEMIGALRKSRPSLPVMAISGAFNGQYLKLAMALGARAALVKPLSVATLLETVEQILRAALAEQQDRSTDA